MEETPMYMEDFFAAFGLIGIVLGIVLLALYIWSIVWAYRDANNRGKPGWLVALLVALLSWPVGLVVWLLFRPTHSRALNE
ncbi:hypothetical protein [Pontibacter burrus]|uniref:Cardiolipin synthase N-terminal domain-containing protein n=1 Tax=Pontibacter burrus TaxID=2704466 RepID=A0A6B3LQS1_9BACT|nr:hypothetical protein [Pontibacter burrus]NEM99159.1 hypothetical protein [Pontibacter burrus]